MLELDEDLRALEELAEVLDESDFLPNTWSSPQIVPGVLDWPASSSEDEADASLEQENCTIESQNYSSDSNDEKAAETIEKPKRQVLKVRKHKSLKSAQEKEKELFAKL